MHTRIKASLLVLAGVGVVGALPFLITPVNAQQPPPPNFGGRGQMRMNNMTAKVTILRAIKTATGKAKGFVNSAVLRPAGPPAEPGGPPHLVWVVHIVTEPGHGPGEPGRGQNIAVDAETNEVVPMPPPMGGPRRGGPGGFGGGPGGFGGRQGGPPPGAGQGGGG